MNDDRRNFIARGPFLPTVKFLGSRGNIGERSQGRAASMVSQTLNPSYGLFLEWSEVARRWVSAAYPSRFRCWRYRMMTIVALMPGPFPSPSNGLDTAGDIWRASQGRQKVMVSEAYTHPTAHANGFNEPGASPSWNAESSIWFEVERS